VVKSARGFALSRGCDFRSKWMVVAGVPRRTRFWGWSAGVPAGVDQDPHLRALMCLTSDGAHGVRVPRRLLVQPAQVGPDQAREGALRRTRFL